MYTWAYKLAINALHKVTQELHRRGCISSATAHEVHQALIVALSSGVFLPPWRLWVIRTLFHPWFTGRGFKCSDPDCKRDGCHGNRLIIRPPLTPPGAVADQEEGMESGSGSGELRQSDSEGRREGGSESDSEASVEVASGSAGREARGQSGSEAGSEVGSQGLQDLTSEELDQEDAPSATGQTRSIEVVMVHHKTEATAGTITFSLPDGLLKDLFFAHLEHVSVGLGYI
jgi:hypothetical protein